MDLKRFENKNEEEGSVMVLLDPTNDTVLRTDDDDKTSDPVTITLLGTDSSVYLDKQRKISNVRLKKMQGGKRGAFINAEQVEDEGLDVLVACTVGWFGISANGEDIPFSPTAARKLYIDYPWIKEQVNEFTADRGNYLGES